MFTLPMSNGHICEVRPRPTRPSPPLPPTPSLPAAPL